MVLDRGNEVYIGRKKKLIYVWKNKGKVNNFRG